MLYEEIVYYSHTTGILARNTIQQEILEFYTHTTHTIGERVASADKSGPESFRSHRCPLLRASHRVRVCVSEVAPVHFCFSLCFCVYAWICVLWYVCGHRCPLFRASHRYMYVCVISIRMRMFILPGVCVYAVITVLSFEPYNV
jgi:hypothetical protein